MKIEVKKKVKKVVEETVDFELKKFWLVRIIKNTSTKSCVKEFRFNYEPKEQDIAECLAEYTGESYFASVNKNYYLCELEEGAEKCTK